MRKASTKGSQYWEEDRDLKLLLNTTCAEGNTKDQDHAHRHEKSQGGVFLRAGAVEAAMLHTLLYVYFRR